jgi:REP element-mobilizing transposase RayT
MEHRFGKIVSYEMILNEFGTIAYTEWSKLPERFPNFELDVFQIMPNHFHAIIGLKDVGANDVGAIDVGATLAVAPNDMVALNDTVAPNNIIKFEAANGAGASPARTGSVSDIVGAFKSLVANGCLEICKAKNEFMGKLWQRNYYEHIIRDERAYHTISEYIINNPLKWGADKFHSK